MSTTNARLAELGVVDARVDRGVVDAITIPAAAFVEHGAALFELEPIRRVDLVRLEELEDRGLETLGRSDLVGRLDALGLPHAVLSRDRFEALFSPKSKARHIRALDLSETVWDVDLISHLADVPPFATTDLGLTNVRVRRSTDEPIAAELLPLFPRVERVTAKRLPGPALVRLIADLPASQVHALDLGVNGYVDSLACRRMTAFEALRSLRLRGFQDLHLVTYPFGDARWLPTIEALELGDGGGWSYGSGTSPLVGALHRTERLEELALHGVHVTNVLAFLTSRLPTLRSLTLHDCAVRPPNVEDLLRCRALESLRHLSLRGRREDLPSAELAERLRARFPSVSIAEA